MDDGEEEVCVTLVGLAGGGLEVKDHEDSSEPEYGSDNDDFQNC